MRSCDDRISFVSCSSSSDVEFASFGKLRNSRSLITMYVVKSLLVLSAVGAIAALPVGETKVDDARESIWKGTPMDALIEEYREECAQQTESTACRKVKVLNFLDEFLSNDTVKMIPNKYESEEVTAARSKVGLFDQMENYIKTHDLVVKPQIGLLQGTTFKLSPRNLDVNEVNMSVKLPSDDKSSAFENRGRKSKLRKILVPILVFVLLKAMTLIPLAIGVLGLKAWNALQLSFISFLVSISLAIFQLCKKVATDSSSQIAAHIPFETSHYAAARNFVIPPEQNDIVQKREDVDAQDMAYRGYVENSS